MTLRRARLPGATALALLAIALPPRVGAADGPPRAQPTLTVAADALHDRSRDGGTSRAAALSARASVPLVDRIHLAPDGVRAWGLAAQAEARAVGLDLPEVDGRARFLRLGAGLAGWYVPSAADTFWLQAGAFVSEQVDLLDAAEVHPRAVAVGTHRTSDALRLLYGVGYTFDFGRGLPIPFLGALWRMAPAWRLDVLLPVVVRATYAASDALSLDFGTGVAGEQFRYRAASPAGPADAGPLELLHVVRLRLGGGCGLGLSPRVRLTLGAGVEGSRIDTGRSTRTAAGAYATASLTLGRRGTAGAPFGER